MITVINKPTQQEINILSYSELPKNENIEVTLEVSFNDKKNIFKFPLKAFKKPIGIDELTDLDKSIFAHYTLIESQIENKIAEWINS